MEAGTATVVLLLFDAVETVLGVDDTLVTDESVVMLVVGDVDAALVSDEAVVVVLVDEELIADEVVTTMLVADADDVLIAEDTVLTIVAVGVEVDVENALVEEATVPFARMYSYNDNRSPPPQISDEFPWQAYVQPANPSGAGPPPFMKKLPQWHLVVRQVSMHHHCVSVGALTLFRTPRLRKRSPRHRRHRGSSRPSRRRRPSS